MSAFLCFPEAQVFMQTVLVNSKQETICDTTSLVTIETKIVLLFFAEQYIFCLHKHCMLTNAVFHQSTRNECYHYYLLVKHLR